MNKTFAMRSYETHNFIQGSIHLLYALNEDLQGPKTYFKLGRVSVKFRYVKLSTAPIRKKVIKL